MRKVRLQGDAFTKHIERSGTGYHLKGYDALHSGRIEQQHASLAQQPGDPTNMKAVLAHAAPADVAVVTIGERLADGRGFGFLLGQLDPALPLVPPPTPP